MHNKKISILTMAIIMSNFIATPIKVLAHEVSNVSLINKKSTESNIAKVSRFEQYYSKNREAYDNKFKMDNSNISSIQSTGKILRQNVGTNNIIDGNINTYWETGKKTSDTFKNEITFTLKEKKTLNRIAYRSASNTVGFAEDFEIWASRTSDGDTFKLVSSGKHSKTSDMLEIRFEPTEFKRIKFVFKNHGTATISEMMFYEEDKTYDEINNMFTNGLMNELKPEYKSLDKINKIKASLNEYPLKEECTSLVDLAKDIVENKVSEYSKVVTLSQRGDENKQKVERRQVFAGGNLDLTGYYLNPQESVEVYVDADENSVLPQIVFSQVGEVDSTGNYRTNLKVGKNIITAPEGTKPFAIYFANRALPTEQPYAPRVRINNKNLNKYPIYIDGVTNPKEYVEEVKNHTGANMTDVMGERFLISGKNSEAKIAYVDGNKTPKDTVKAMDKLINAFDKYSGLDKNDPNPIHRPSKALYHYKGNTASGLFASNEYIHYSDSSARNMFAGDVSGWGFIHEYAHQMENSDMRLLEVTNNLYSIYLQKEFGLVGRNLTANQNTIDKYFTFEGTKGFGGFGETYDLTFGLFERLLVLTQITNYFGDEVYGKAYRMIRENPQKYNTGSYQAIITALSEATGYNLVPHFEYYNYPITKETKEFTSKFKTLDKKIRYTTIDTYKKREENVQRFNKETKAVVDVKKEKDGFTLTMSTNDNNKGTIAYEIYRDGKLVGFNRTGKFKDVVDSSKEYKYQVIAYDYMANESIKSDEFNTASIIYKPSIEVEDNIFIAKNEKFDPLNYIKAITFDNKKIDKSKIKITENVDEKNTGKYQVTYEVDDRGNISLKTVNVIVFENYLVKKSRYNDFESLDKQKQAYKIPIVSVTNNAGNYGNSVITKAIDGKKNTHWETNKPNSSTFKNEVTFDLGKVQNIGKMVYASRADANGKGFAQKFEIYTSEEASGDDFVLAGKGEYKSVNRDIVEFNLNDTKARRVKFKFVEAFNNWASLSEVRFYNSEALIEDNIFYYLEEDNWQTTSTMDELNEYWDYSVINNEIVLNRYKGNNNKVEIPRRVDGKNVVVKTLEDKMFPNVTHIRVAKPKNGEPKVKVNTRTLKLAFANSHIEYVDLSGIDTSKLTNLYGMFKQCRNLKYANLSGWDVSKVTDVEYMFFDDVNLEGVGFSQWKLPEKAYVKSLSFTGNTPKLKTKILDGVNDKTRKIV